ncbi:MAG TPA: hypothetical protein VGL94_00355 [Ktedonobacteraceae bacterium]|jgi:hypothetical protein
MRLHNRRAYPLEEATHLREEIHDEFHWQTENTGWRSPASCHNAYWKLEGLATREWTPG